MSFDKPTNNNGSHQHVYFDLAYEGEFPVANYYVNKFGTLYNYYSVADRLKPTFVKKVIEKEGFEPLYELNRITQGYDITFQKIYGKNNCLIDVSYRGKETEISQGDFTGKVDYVTITIYYDNIKNIQSVIKRIKAFTKDDNHEGNISLIIQKGGGLTTVRYPVKVNDLDIELNYGKKFLKVYDKIVTKLNEEKGKGLVLFHGSPGTGKTTLLRHLATEIDKEVLFVPPIMAESISDPSFITFLMNHSNSILIVEDAERIVLDRDDKSSSSQGVSNLLNLTDGILSDCLGIQVIATFNTDRNRIDKALLRKGRLISEHKFEALSIEETNKLLEQIGKPSTATKGLTLSEIYGIDEEVQVIQKTENTIGFNRY